MYVCSTTTQVYSHVACNSNKSRRPLSGGGAARAGPVRRGRVPRAGLGARRRAQAARRRVRLPLPRAAAAAARPPRAAAAHAQVQVLIDAQLYCIKFSYFYFLLKLTMCEGSENLRLF